MMAPDCRGFSFPSRSVADGGGRGSYFEERHAGVGVLQSRQPTVWVEFDVWFLLDFWKF